MTLKLLAATGNKGKLREIRQLLPAPEYEVLGLSDVEVEGEPIEDGATFAANARIKAAFCAAQVDMPVMADDSGLCVDALDGAPGVHSARYAGPAADDRHNNAKLLREMKGRTNRAARFVCTVVCVKPGGEAIEATGECRGVLLEEPRGVSGFGYDPLFYVPHLNATFAELPAEAKNKISHRGRALQKLAELLPEFLSVPCGD